MPEVEVSIEGLPREASPTEPRQWGSSVLALLSPPTPEMAELWASWISSHLPASQIALVTELAVRVFGDREVAVNWLRQPNFATDNQPPIQILGTDYGFERVQNLLLRIEYGVLV